MIVMKFGGSSIESATAIERVAGIVAARAKKSPLIVIVSAMGRTTDRLASIARAAAGGDREDALERLEALRAFHFEHGRAVCPSRQLNELRAFLDEHFVELATIIKGLVALGELTPRSLDAVFSFGERLSSYIVALALHRKGVDAQRVDSRNVMITDANHGGAQPLLGPLSERLATRVQPLTVASKTVVLGGFIGVSEEGASTTLGRGGSDYSASLIGAVMGADEVQIWTDVDGVMTADPSLVDGARRVRVMSFDEAAELAYFGARVLHPSTMAPAIDKDIPIRVLNSRRPDSEGTLIVSEPPESEAIVKSIAYKRQITVVDVHSSRMLMAHGFLAKVFGVFEKFETAVDMVTTSEVSVSLTVDNTMRLEAILGELAKVAEVSRCSGQAIVCVVGDGIRHTTGVSAKIFSALDGLAIRMISVGASRRNVSLVVDESDLNQVVRRLHETFFAEVDEAVFA